MLNRHENVVNSHGSDFFIFVFIFNGDLNFGIRFHPFANLVFPAEGDPLDQLVAQIVAQRHQNWSFISCIAYHKALIACTNILVLFVDMNCFGDFSRLLIQRNHDGCIFIVKSFIHAVVSDVFYCLSDNLLILNRSFWRYFSENHAKSVFARRLASHFRKGVLGKCCI